MHRAGLVLLAGVALGAVGGFALSYAILERRGYDEPIASSRRVEEPAREPASPAPPLASSPASVGGDSAIGGAARADDRTLAGALAAIPAGSWEARGDGVIRGRVRTPSGDPVGGVTVRAEAADVDASSMIPGGPAPEPSSLEEAVRELVHRHRRRDALRREATSGPDGSYAVRGLADAEYRLRAWRDGYAVQPENLQQSFRASSGSAVNFVAEPRTRVIAHVFLPDGTAPRRARLETEGAGRRDEMIWWDRNDPVVYLEPGSHRMRAIAGDDLEYASPERSVTIPVVGDTSLEFRLVERTGILGRVVFADGDRTHTLFVLQRKIREGEDPRTILAMSDRSNRRTITATRPVFAFHDLAPGLYAVGVGRGWDSIDAHATVVVGAGMASVELRLPSLEESGAVVLYAYGPDGEEATDLSVTLRARSRERRWSSRVTVQERDGGGVWLAVGSSLEEVGRRLSLEDASFLLEIASDAYGVEPVPFRPDADRELTVRFSHPSGVEVVVPGYRGSGLEDRLTVDILDPQTKRTLPSASRRRLDPEGRTVVEPLQPGRCDVVLYVTPPGARHGRFELARAAVDLGGARRTVTLPIPPLYTLTVVIPPENDTRRMSLSASSAGSMEVTVDETRRARFPDLPAGRYLLHDTGGGFMPMSVSVPEQLEVEYRPESQNALVVEITDPQGSLARAGFADGDVIVGADGQAFETLTALQVRVLSARGDERMPLLVRRGSRELEIALDAATFRDAEGWGGTIHPTVR